VRVNLFTLALCFISLGFSDTVLVSTNRISSGEFKPLDPKPQGIGLAGAELISITNLKQKLYKIPGEKFKILISGRLEIKNSKPWTDPVEVEIYDDESKLPVLGYYRGRKITVAGREIVLEIRFYEYDGLSNDDLIFQGYQVVSLPFQKQKSLQTAFFKLMYEVPMNSIQEALELGFMDVPEIYTQVLVPNQETTTVYKTLRQRTYLDLAHEQPPDPSSIDFFFDSLKLKETEDQENSQNPSDFFDQLAEGDQTLEPAETKNRGKNLDRSESKTKSLKLQGPDFRENFKISRIPLPYSCAELQQFAEFQESVETMKYEQLHEKYPRGLPISGPAQQGNHGLLIIESPQNPWQIITFKGPEVFQEGFQEPQPPTQKQQPPAQPRYWAYRPPNLPRGPMRYGTYPPPRYYPPPPRPIQVFQPPPKAQLSTPKTLEVSKVYQHFHLLSPMVLDGEVIGGFISTQATSTADLVFPEQKVTLSCKQPMEIEGHSLQLITMSFKTYKAMLDSKNGPEFLAPCYTVPSQGLTAPREGKMSKKSLRRRYKSIYRQVRDNIKRGRQLLLLAPADNRYMPLMADLYPYPDGVPFELVILHDAGIKRVCK
jgi:hypothetical protein